MLGPSTTEANWLLICLDATRYRAAGAMRQAAESVLDNLTSNLLAQWQIHWSRTSGTA